MRLAAFIVILLAFALTPVFIFGDAIDEHFGGAKGVERLSAYGAGAWVFAIGLIIGDLVLPVPTPAVMAALGLLYGPILGGFIGGIGSILAGLVAYGGCRLLGPRVAAVLAGEENLPKLSRFFDRSGSAAIAFSRWLPILPEGLTCLAGLARMPIVPFLTSLSLGSFAMGFAFAYLGSAYNEHPTTGILISAIIPLALWPVIHRWLRDPKTTESSSSKPVSNIIDEAA
ncbi:VTT domain-containing protein [bacterium]|nr:VTT domain-containing protein [bacterium]